jgi:hypothetical protein
MEERPPVLKSWGRLYAVVLSFLLLQIIAYYFFTVAFR